MEEQNAIDREEYRVGCWDGGVEDGVAYITHDSVSEEVKVDVEEISDLDSLVDLLLRKDKINRGATTLTEEDFDDIVRSMDA